MFKRVSSPAVYVHPWPGRGHQRHTVLGPDGGGQPDVRRQSVGCVDQRGGVLGFRLSRRPPTDWFPYGLDRAEDLAGIGIAVVIWASAVFAGYESVRKLLVRGPTQHTSGSASREPCWGSRATRSWPATSSPPASGSGRRR
jgi:Cation efflux family